MQAMPTQITNGIASTFNPTLKEEKEEAEENDDGEDEDDELCEPKFKYKRILNDLSRLFSQDTTSCLAVSEKFLALGTHFGRIYIIDHLGNILPDKIIVPHQTAVNQISIDNCGDYLISCSNDGKVCIYGLACPDYNQVLSMSRPIRSVAISNDFSKSNSGQQFATGDRVLILHERSFFNKDRQLVIFAGKDRDGFIQTISWCGCYIAFSNDTGTRIYDRTLRQLITHVVRKHDLSLRSDLHPPRICWLTSESLVITWAHTVTICVVKVNTTHSNSTGDLPGKLVEIRHMWDIEGHSIAGVSFTKELSDGFKELVLFCLPTKDQMDQRNEQENDKSNLPRVLLVEPLGFSEFEILTEDMIEMRDSEDLLLHQYHLDGIPAECLYFLLGKKDMIEVRPCSVDDRVDWLLKNGMHEKALHFATQNAHLLDHFSVHDVGRKYLNSLLSDGHLQQAAALCPQICGKRKDVWEYYVTEFERRKQLRILAGFLPTKEPQLEPECYEMALNELLDDDGPAFRRLVREWSPDLYRVGGLITRTLERLYKKNLDRDGHNSLLLTLATLYTYERNYQRALAIYMSLGDRAVFPLIERYRLFPQVQNKISVLLGIDADLAVRLLLENEDHLPSSTVMTQLNGQPRLQLAYLDRLFSRNEGEQFADLAVHLYADHDRKRLLPFLRRSDLYRIDKALETCRNKSLTEEVVFLLGRGGNRKEALKVITDQQQDIHKAIDFCKEHDDPDLWADLVHIGLLRPDYTTALLHQVGTHLDPLKIIEPMPPSMRILGLRDSLVKILADHALQISLQEGCRRATLMDADQFMCTLNRSSTKGMFVGTANRCSHCSRSLLSVDSQLTGDLVLFFCGHSSHKSCLNNSLVCLKCTSKCHRTS